MINAGSVQVKLFADTKQYMTAMTAAGATMNKMGKKVETFASTSILAFAAFTAAASKMATDFDKRLREISTLIIGVTENDIKNLSREIRDVAMVTGKALDDIGKAKYDIISAGFTDMAEAAQLLDTSSRLAVGGVTSVTNAADLLTSALNSFQISGLRAEEAADVLFTTVRLGKTTMDELVGSVGRVFPTAKTLGASLADVGAAMATITAGGIKTYEAATYLNQAFTKLGAPSDQAAEAMRLHGIQVYRTNDGMLDLLKTIKQFKGYDLEQMRKFFPEIRAIKAVLAMANNMSFLERALKDTTNASGATQTAFKKMSEAWSVKLSKSVMKLKNEMIELGDDIMPRIVVLFDEFIEKLNVDPDKIVGFSKTLLTILSDMIPIIANLLPLVAKLSVAYLAINTAIKAGVVLNKAYQWSMAAMVGTTSALTGAIQLLNVALWKVKANILTIGAITGVFAAIGTIVVGISSATKAWKKYIKERDKALDEKFYLADGSEVIGKDIPLNYKINVSAYFDKNAKDFIELTKAEKTKKQMQGHSTNISTKKMAATGDPMYSYLQQAQDNLSVLKQTKITSDKFLKEFEPSIAAYNTVFGNFADEVLGSYAKNFVLKLTEYKDSKPLSELLFGTDESYQSQMRKLESDIASLDIDAIIPNKKIGSGLIIDMNIDDAYQQIKNLYESWMKWQFDIDKEMLDAFDIPVDDILAIVKMLEMINIPLSEMNDYDFKDAFDMDKTKFMEIIEMFENWGYSIDDIKDKFGDTTESIEKDVYSLSDVISKEFSSIADSISSTMANSFAEMVLAGRVATQELEQYNKGLTNDFRTAAEIQEEAWANMWNNILLDTARAVIEFGIKMLAMAGAILLADAISQGTLIPLIKGAEGASEAATKMGNFFFSLFGGGENNLATAIGNILPVGDAVITPQGQVVQTDPNDYLIATKTPNDLGGSGGNMEVHIHAVDAKSFEDLMVRNPQAVARGVGHAVEKRNLKFNQKGSRIGAEY